MTWFRLTNDPPSSVNTSPPQSYLSFRHTDNHVTCLFLCLLPLRSNRPIDSFRSGLPLSDDSNLLSRCTTSNWAVQITCSPLRLWWRCVTAQEESTSLTLSVPNSCRLAVYVDNVSPRNLHWKIIKAAKFTILFLRKESVGCNVF